MTRSKEESAAKLREILSVGSTVQTILRHTSRSGMSRSISPIVDGQDVSYLVAPLLDRKVDQNNGGIKLGGCGMDMGFELVYEMGYALWPDGFMCCGNETFGRTGHFGCHSNDQSNGDRDYTPHIHKDGGYALRQAWL